MVGCSHLTVDTQSIERPKLGLTVPSPLELRPTQFKILKYEDKMYFALDTEGYENLSKNTEDIQNRLYVYHNIIKQQKEYYENRK